MIFNHKIDFATDTLDQAVDDTKEWFSNQEETGLTCTPRNATRNGNSTHKKKPTTRWVKCNFDAYHHEGNQSSGLGWIIRNCNGIFLNCGMEQFQGKHTIEEVEARALIWALQSAWRLDYRKSRI